MNSVDDINLQECFSYWINLSIFTENTVASQFCLHCMCLVADNWSLDQGLRSSSQKQGPEGEGEMAKEGGQASANALIPGAKEPCSAEVCRKAGWGELGMLCHGRARRQCCSRQGCRPGQRPLSVAPQSRSRHLLSCTTTCSWSYARITDGGGQDFLPPQEAQSFCGLCCDKPPWAEPHKSAINEPVLEESFHSGTIYLLWLQSSLMCLQRYSLHR